MKYNIRNIDNIQQMQDRLLLMKDSIAQLQKMIEEQECELELVENQNRRGNHHLLSDSSGKTIKGVRQFARYIDKSITTSQNILNSNVLQDNGVAYRVGNTWTINIERLDQLIADDPQILRCRRVKWREGGKS